MTAAEPKHPALNSVYWREEILEVALWLRGEGFSELLDAGVLQRFLGIPASDAAGHLARLTSAGYLRRLADGRYGLTDAGEEEGARLTGGARAVPAPPGGPCGPGCWCDTSPFEASSCETYRVG